MLVGPYFKNINSFYSFLCDALLEEATKEKANIHFEYRFPDDRHFYDIYLERGLKRFNGKSSKPIVIETKYRFNETSIMRFVRQAREETRFTGKIVFIVCDSVPKESLYFLNDYDVDIYGKELIDDLIKQYPDSYLNQLTSNEDINLNVKRGRQVEIVDSGNKQFSFVERSLIKQSSFTISKDSPEKISLINGERFKNLFRNNNEKCALILGNGVSIPFGSDTWKDTIKNMADYLRPSLIENSEAIMDSLSNSSYAISSFVKSTLFDAGLKDKYYEAIRYSIYRKYNELMHREDTLIKVIAQAKHNYPLVPVLTYNYDTFVEKQYGHDFNGGRLDYISGIDSVNHLNDCVVHLHGYISYTTNKINGIVLTDEEYFDTYFSPHNNWSRDLQKDVLLKHKCLFVGSSMSDIFQMSLISDVKKMYKDRDSSSKDNWNCYALLCFNNPNLGIKGKIKLIEFYQKRGIKVIFVDSYEKLPQKLKSLLS